MDFRNKRSNSFLKAIGKNVNCAPDNQKKVCTQALTCAVFEVRKTYLLAMELSVVRSFTKYWPALVQLSYEHPTKHNLSTRESVNRE